MKIKDRAKYHAFELISLKEVKLLAFFMNIQDKKSFTISKVYGNKY